MHSLLQLLISFSVIRKSSGSKSTWSEEQEDELERLYEEFKDVQDAGKTRYTTSRLICFFILPHLLSVDGNPHRMTRAGLDLRSFFFSDVFISIGFLSVVVSVKGMVIRWH